VFLGKRGVFLSMVFVKAQPGDSSDSLIRKFSRKVLSEGVLQDLKKREFYQKPAEVRKQKSRELARRLKHPNRG
jgi:small subunit ribosomal protein S21